MQVKLKKHNHFRKYFWVGYVVPSLLCERRRLYLAEPRNYICMQQQTFHIAASLDEVVKMAPYAKVVIKFTA